jgi:hypothetical protein
VGARLALDLVAGDRADDCADRSSGAVFPDFVSNHRAANTAGDRADARAFAGHVDRLHFDDHAAVVARRCDVLLSRHVLGGLRDHRRLGLRAGQATATPAAMITATAAPAIRGCKFVLACVSIVSSVVAKKNAAGEAYLRQPFKSVMKPTNG